MQPQGCQGLKTYPQEVLGLLALMLLHDSRRRTRIGPAGELIILEEQDRSQWDHGEIADGLAVLERALRYKRPGPYQSQAAISALHAQAPTAVPEPAIRRIVLMRCHANCTSRPTPGTC
jgi:RNA polymerase sigma-70 factor (ECF subfamily)